MECLKCGGTGISIVNGQPCNYCKKAKEIKKFVKDEECNALTFIPLTYRGRSWDIRKNSKTLSSSVKSLLDGIMTAIKYDNLQENYCLCIPASYDLDLFIFTCLTRIMENSQSIFPYKDVTEIQSDIEDVDSMLYKVDILFLSVPTHTQAKNFYLIQTLLSRRVRKGLFTFFVYNGSWDEMIRFDTSYKISGLKGDGIGMSLRVVEERSET